MNNKAVLYLRLSKEDRNKVNKGDDSESIINQRIMLSDYAMRHNFQVVKIYSDAIKKPDRRLLFLSIKFLSKRQKICWHILTTVWAKSVLT